jgi:hypothetical protein
MNLWNREPAEKVEPLACNSPAPGGPLDVPGNWAQDLALLYIGRFGRLVLWIMM